jgi:hypothetical protein
MATGSNEFPMSSVVKQQARFFDKSFNESLIPYYSLSIQISLNRIAFAVYDSDSNRFIGFSSSVISGKITDSGYNTLIDSVVNEYKWLSASFQSVNIILESLENTLIPISLYDDSNRKLYHEFTHEINKQYQIEKNELKSVQAVNLFSLPVELAEKMENQWPDSRIFHFSSVLIESLAINFKNKTDNNSLFVDLKSDSFDLVYFKDNVLHFHNSFRFKTAEDFIYFLLSAAERLKLNPEEMKVTLMGDIDKSTQNYHMLYNYIRHSEFIERNETFRYSHVLDELMRHKFYVLFNVFQCE